MLTFLSKIFGSKSDRDIKHIQPLVERIKEEYAKLDSLSHDELRSKTVAFKQRIAAYLETIDKSIDYRQVCKFTGRRIRPETE